MPSDKIPPSISDYGYRVIGWCKEAVQESDEFLRGQIGYSKAQESIDTIMGTQADLRSMSLSSTECNQAAKIFFDMSAGMTDVKPFWEYRTYNKRFENQCSIYGKLSHHSWLQQGMDLSFMFTVQYALACGSSYLEPYWDTRIEDFKAEAWDPRDVLPIRPTTSPSIQDCYGVIARKARSTNHVKYLCKHVFQREDLVKYIQADRDSSALGASLRNTRVGAVLDRLGVSPFQQRLFGDKAQRDIPRMPTTDVFTCYIDDDSINESKNYVQMGAFDKKTGEPLSNWSERIAPGERLYPRKRMIVYANGMPEPMYDGPSPWWHGMYPFPKLTLDVVPWSFLGKAPMWDLLPLNQSLNKMLRVYDDWLARLARPDVWADKSVSQHLIDRMDTRRAGKKVRASMLQKGTIQLVGPDALPQDFWKGIEFYLNRMDNLSGAQDLSSMMKLNQMPSADSIEQIIENMSLTWQMRSRVVEVFMREYALMMAYNYAQFYTLPRRLTILGGEGVTPQDFDMDPGSLVPDFTHAEDFNEGMVSPQALARGPLPRINRAREFLRQFTFQIAPGSLLGRSEWQKKMMYLQLSRAGLLDHWTLMDALAIPNVGSPPAGVNTITDRLKAEQDMGLGMSVSPAGRKASGQSSPRLTMKES